MSRIIDYEIRKNKKNKWNNKRTNNRIYNEKNNLNFNESFIAVSSKKYGLFIITEDYKIKVKIAVEDIA